MRVKPKQDRRKNPLPEERCPRLSRDPVVTGPVSLEDTIAEEALSHGQLTAERASVWLS